MKPIPKELQPYTDALRPYDGYDRDRPWWTLKSVGPGRDVELVWTRTDGRTAKPIGYSTGVGTPPVDLPATDKANPLPPPSILVGQVWAGVGEDGMVAFEILTIGPARDGGAEVYAWGLNVATPVADLIERGYLLRCPYGYAPWSGPEVAP